MKRIIAFLLACALVLSGCGTSYPNTSSNGESGQPATADAPEFTGLDDPALRSYIADTTYANLLSEIDTDRYFVENVQTAYVSKEYIDELSYNSKSNLYFGYSLADIESIMLGTKYVFTLDESGQTTVKTFEAYDNTYDQAVRNVAIGTGVILVCVTVSAVTAGAGFPAVSTIFAVSAKTSAEAALCGGALSAAAAGITTGIQTGDMEAAIKAVALSGSEGFMWGAIGGSVARGASEAVALKGATLNGLTMNEAAFIQKESGYPLDVIKQFQSVDQYNICKKAGLRPQMINGRTSLLREIDLNFKDSTTGKTNLELMKNGYAPVDPATGLKYELHHIGQQNDSTLAILTKAEHMQDGNNSIWHEFGSESNINRQAFSQIRQDFWKEFAHMAEAGEL